MTQTTETQVSNARRPSRDPSSTESHFGHVLMAAPDIGEVEKARILDVLDSGILADGPEVRAFEAEFAAFCGVRYGVATSNGTTALHAALVALGVGPGDAVVTTPFSFVASANAIRYVGATPVFADIDPVTYTLDPDAVETVLRERDDVTAILAVHLYGHPARIDRFCELAERYGVFLVEDAAQAHGAKYGEHRVGGYGDVACFSFYPTKNMTTGEGGMIVTDDAGIAERAARYVNHGRAGVSYGHASVAGGHVGSDDRTGSDGRIDVSRGHTGARNRHAIYDHADLGHNFRMTSVAAAIGRAQLEKLPAYNVVRRAHARRLTALLSGSEILTTPTESPHARHVYHQYTIRTPYRDALAAYLRECGVDTGVYYPTPIHRQPAYRGIGNTDERFPVAERAAREVLSLPVHPKLTDEEVRYVADCVRAFEASVTEPTETATTNTTETAIPVEVVESTGTVEWTDGGNEADGASDTPGDRDRAHDVVDRAEDG